MPIAKATASEAFTQCKYKTAAAPRNSIRTTETVARLCCETRACEQQPESFMSTFMCYGGFADGKARRYRTHRDPPDHRHRSVPRIVPNCIVDCVGADRGPGIGLERYLNRLADACEWLQVRLELLQHRPAEVEQPGPRQRWWWRRTGSVRRLSHDPEW